jgi:hypothetical protein
MLRFLVGLQVTNRKLNQDIIDLKKKIEASVKELLVPWGPEELELLSLNHHSKKIQKGFHKAVQGVFNSIYYEPMIAFAYKEYYNISRRAIIVARTDDHEFIYKIKSNRTEIFVDGKSFGLMNNEGQLISVYRKKIASIKADNVEYLTVNIGQKHVANLMNPQTAEDTHLRVIELFQNINSEQEIILMSVIIPELITRAFPNLRK